MPAYSCESNLPLTLRPLTRAPPSPSTLLHASLVLVPILGITWILGFFVVGEDVVSTIIEWLFFAFTTLQGVAIFTMHCVVKKEVLAECIYIIALERLESVALIRVCEDGELTDYMCVLLPGALCTPEGPWLPRQGQEADHPHGNHAPHLTLQFTLSLQHKLTAANGTSQEEST